MRYSRPLALAGLLAACAAGCAQAAVLKLDFTSDRYYDADHLVGMFRHADPAGIEWRARSMGIDPELAKKIRDAEPAEAQSLARKMVDDVFALHRDEIAAAQEAISRKWTSLIEPFSDAVTRSTQRPWRHPEYVCVVSAVHPGQSDWHGNKVAIGYNKPQFWLRVLAHEIVLSDAYQIMYDAHGGERHELDDWQIWAFSEITAVLILDDPALNRFWPDTPPAGHYYGGANYPQLAEFEGRLKSIYDERKSFDDFMAKAVAVLQQFHHGDVRDDIKSAFDRVAGLRMMAEDGRSTYTLPARGQSLSGLCDDFLRRRTPDEILASGLSSGCGDYAAAFYGLMRQKGASLLYVDSAELSAASLLNRDNGHTGVAVKDPANGRWLLADPTNRKILSEAWSPDAKIYDGPAGRMWIGYVGRLEDYPVKSHDELKAFYDRTLRAVPAAVWDEELVRLEFSTGPSMLGPDGAYLNARCPQFLQRYGGVYDQLGVHPKRRAQVLFSDESLNAAGKDCRRTGAGSWECFVKRAAAMSPGWFSYIETQVMRQIAAPWGPIRFIVDASMRRGDGLLFNPLVESFVRGATAEKGSLVRLIDGGPGSQGSCAPGHEEVVCRVGREAGMGDWLLREIARVSSRR